MRNAGVIRASKGQGQAEGGLRLLKRSTLLCLTLVGAKALSDLRAADGDDLRAASTGPRRPSPAGVPLI